MEKRRIEFIPKCLAISFKRKGSSVKHTSSDDLFERFVTANSYCYWNINLKEVFDKCELVGHIRPYCLLISGADIFIQSIKLAYQKRLLKAPDSFSIHYIGDVDSVNCNSVTPSQFVSLDEALCYVIYDLNLLNEISEFDQICCRLAEWYPGLQLPPQSLILATLRNLIDSGQVYYTGYGYSIMTNDRMFVAQWLGEQGPEESVSRGNSFSDVSGVEKVDLKQRSKSDRVDNKRSSLPRSSKSMDTMRLYQNCQASTMVPLEDSLKRTKARSAVRQFFAKLRPGHPKNRLPTMATTVANADNIYSDYSNYYSFSRTQPRFYSSNVEFTTPIPRRAPPMASEDVSKPQWLWRTSVQSLPFEADSVRKSPSSYSRVSTRAIHDDSPPPTIRSSKGHRSKSRNRHSLRSDRTCSREERDTLQEDSGVHSISGSNDPAKYPSSRHRYQSRDLEPADLDVPTASSSPPSARHQERARQRLSHSFSTRLSSISRSKTLDPVLERAKWDYRDDKHVAFTDGCERAC